MPELGTKTSAEAPAHIVPVGPAPGLEAPGGADQSFAAYALGALYVGLGLVGFAVTGGLGVTSTEGARLIGFELNPLQNVAHIALGVLLAAGAASGARPARVMHVSVGLALLGLAISGLFLVGTDANVLALNQADNGFHMASAALALALGVFGGPAPDGGRRSSRRRTPRRATSSADADPIVDARDVAKAYRSGPSEMRALRGTDLRVARGEMVAVVGPSGSGKTTLLNTLSGLDDVDAGEIRIAGEDIHGLSDRRRTAFRARSMGFVFQAFNLVPVFSAAENVELPLLLVGVAPGEARRRAERMLARVGLEHRVGHRPAELSGGEQQRVAVARALAPEPRIVWCDEPTGNLDSVTAEGVMELLEELNAEGLTIVLVTHDRAVAERADRVLTMQDGVIVGEEVRA